MLFSASANDTIAAISRTHSRKTTLPSVCAIDKVSYLPDAALLGGGRPGDEWSSSVACPASRTAGMFAYLYIYLVAVTTGNYWLWLGCWRNPRIWFCLRPGDEHHPDIFHVYSEDDICIYYTAYGTIRSTKTTSLSHYLDTDGTSATTHVTTGESDCAVSK